MGNPTHDVVLMISGRLEWKFSMGSRPFGGRDHENGYRGGYAGEMPSPGKLCVTRSLWRHGPFKRKTDARAHAIDTCLYYIIIITLCRQRALNDASAVTYIFEAFARTPGIEYNTIFLGFLTWGDRERLPPTTESMKIMYCIPYQQYIASTIYYWVNYQKKKKMNYICTLRYGSSITWYICYF